MLIPILFLSLLCLWRLKLNLSNQGFISYLDKDITESVKGLFVLIVFLSHFNKYTQYTWAFDVYAFNIIGIIGQAMVVPFMVYSGFGVMESIKRKGISYVKGMPRNRLLKVILIYEFVNIFSILVEIILNGSISLEYFILSVVSWFDWYILAIILLYFFTYFSYLVFRDKYNYGPFVLLIVVLTIMYIATFSLIGVGSYYYDTVLCYSIGILWSIYKEKLDKIFANNVMYYLVLFVLTTTIIITKIVLPQHLIFVLIAYVLIALLLLLITKKVQINNGILNWCGKHLFEIHLVHRIPMDIFHALGISLINNYLYLILCILVTIIIVKILELTLNRWVQHIIKGKEKIIQYNK